MDKKIGQKQSQAGAITGLEGSLVWVVSDGTAGMVSQALALAQAMRLTFYDVRIFASPIYRLFPQMGAWPLMPISPRRQDRRLGPPWPDIIINCGKRTVGASLAIKRLSGGKTKIVQIQDPKIDPAHFAVMVTPYHDPISQQGLPHLVLSKGSLNRLSMTEIAKAAKELPRRYKSHSGAKTAVMIGGDNKRYQPSAADYERLGKALADFARQQKRHLILISSRRTGQQALAIISAALGRLSHQIWDGLSDNPYPGILGVVDDIIVTSDSVNMTSEACLTGKPVYIASLQDETGRIAAFHKMMTKEGHTKALGEHFDAPPEILDETKDIALRVRDMLSL